MSGEDIARLSVDYEALRARTGVSGRFGLRALTPASLTVGVKMGIAAAELYTVLAKFVPDQGWLMIHGANSRVISFTGGVLPNCAINGGEEVHYGEMLLKGGVALHVRRTGQGGDDGAIWAYALDGAVLPNGFDQVGEEMTGLMAQETFLANEGGAGSSAKVAYQLFYQGGGTDSSAPTMSPMASIFAGLSQ
jgi:hypothetical protein